MKEDIAKLWIEELRSGKYQQGTGNLNKNNKFCCLGVLSEMAYKEGICNKEDDGGLFSYFDKDTHINCRGSLTDGIREWSGIKDSLGKYACRYLSSDNDSGKTFNEIADIIEKNVNSL